MYSSFVVYSILASELNEQLTGLQVSAIFSNTRDELVFHFEGPVNKQLQIRFAGGEMHFFTDEISTYPGRNAINQFRQLDQQILAEVQVLPFDRAFCMRFGNGARLYFRGYGKFGNLLLYDHRNVPDAVFRKELKADETREEKGFAFAQSEPQYPIESSKSLKSAFPWLTEELQIFLGSDFFELKGNSQQGKVKDLLNAIQAPALEINLNTDPPELHLLGKKHNGNQDNWEILQQFSHQYLNRFYFLEEKNLRLQRLKQKLRHFEQLEASQQKAIDAIATRRSFKELGDIILSYAHKITPGVSSAFLPDYFTGEQIRIKLDPKLNAAENATRYYRKAQNESLEKQRLESDLQATRLQLTNLQSELAILESASDFKGLRQTSKPELPKVKQDSKPYKTVMVEGFEIWIGKNARSNDEMLKLASKSDLWLHARGFAGSHVIVRKQGNRYPDQVIKAAAKLAAQNSRAKTQKLVPVYCVERKFVTKPKRAAAGEVVVLKETVVDAILD